MVGVNQYRGYSPILKGYFLRITAFGFLASEEVLNANATNLGLRDRTFPLLTDADHPA